MEKQKLIQIILKDLRELNDIANGLGRSQGLSNFEIDIALSKSKLIYQEFQFLQEMEKQKVEIPSIPKPVEAPAKETLADHPAPQVETVAQEEAEEERPTETPTAEKPATVSEEKVEEQHKHETAAEANITDEEITAENKNEPLESTTTKEAIEVEEIVAEAPAPEEEPQKKDDTIDEKELTEEPTEQKIVGENFAKGKSLNDLLLESKTLDQKLANSPIEKLETAIGLNDRFQYTRELFNNNPELFRDTVKEIDQSTNLEEAVSFLNSNFKWKKTETSIQFAQLVKRRFTN
ncbi:hypothetical protein [Sunxiuqinia elliptica]|uniref:Uncharacterized protein n=1 Tax=Sunxiuqinia elliptica TaxID=655355 RepID=A0A4R6H599_9BACT|nr:hypothetical protein [Sunxiuqinia elliptica]TDO02616.1 hypothetical protein DET52_10481 [Sunxiuqinia elliptica]TDO58646.1 hypothetical protein DET65_3171 [Sunxiuqinia elliptica]